MRSSSATRTALRVLAVIVALLVVIPVTALIAVQNDGVARWAANRLLAMVNPFPGRSIVVGAVRGTWWSGLTLIDVRLAPATVSPSVALDTLHIRYGSLVHLARTRQIDELDIAGLTAATRRQVDGSWDLLAPFLHRQPPTPADTIPGAPIVISSLAVRRLSLAALDRDSAGGAAPIPTRLTGLTLAARDLQLGTPFGGRIDSLTARVVPPRAGVPPADLRLAGSLLGGRLDVPSLTARAGASRIAAHATLRLPDRTHAGLRDVDIAVDADPVRFADIAPLVPALETTGTASLHLEARGDANRVGLHGTVAFARNGRIAMEGYVTPRATDFEDSLALHLSDVDPRAILAAVSSGLVSGTAVAQLRGPSVKKANGTATIDLRPVARYGTYTARDLVARATLSEGVAHVTLNGDMRPWRVAATGTVAPFDSVHTYVARAHVVTIGTHPAALSSADASATLRGQRVRFELHGMLAGGTARATGDATLGTPLAWRITDGAIDRVNVSRAMGDTGSSTVSGTFTAAGHGTAPAAVVAQARVRLSRSTYHGIDLRAATADIAMQGGRAEARLVAHLDTGTITANVSAVPLGTSPSVVVHRVTLAHLDAARLTGDTALSTDLNGVLTGSARWRAHAPMARTLRARARFVLAPSRIVAQSVDSAAVTLDLGRGTARWNATMSLPRGDIALGGDARPFDAEPAFSVEHGTFRRLDLGALLGDTAMHTDLTGTLAARVRGLRPDSAHWSATLSLASSSVRDAAIDSAQLALTLDSGLVHVAAALHAPRGQGEGSVDGRLVRTYARHAFSLQRVLSESDLRLRAAGTWTLASLTTDTSIMVGVVDTLALPPDSLIARARLANGRVSIDTLRVHSVLGQVTGTGSAAVVASAPGGAASPPPNLRLTLVTGNLAPLAPVIGASVLSIDSGRAEATVTGTADAPQVQFTARMRGIAENTTSVDVFTADAAATLTRRHELASARATIAASDAELGGLHARQVDVAMTYGDSAHLSLSTTLDDGTTARLGLAGAADAIQRQVRLDSLAIEHGKYQWALTHPVRLGYGDRYSVQDFVLASNTGRRIAINGTAGRTGTEQLSVELDSVSLAPLARVVGYHALAGSRVDARATLTGTATEPVLHADAAIVLPEAHADSGTVRATVDWTSTRLDLKAAITPVDGHPLTVSGYLPSRLVLAPGAAPRIASVAPHGAVDLRIAADSFDLEMIEPFLNAETVDQVRGALTMDARVTGRADAPLLGGTLALRGLLLRMPALGVTYEQGIVRAELANDRLRIDTALVRSADGTLRLAGSVVLRQLTLGEFDLTATLAHFRAVWSDAYQVVASGSIAFKGTTKAPALTGALTVDNGTLDMSAMTSGGNATPVNLTEDELRSLEARFGHDAVRAGGKQVTPFFDLLALDLKVTTNRDAWVKRRANPQLQIELSGTVEARKDPHGALRLYGALEPIEGRSFVAQFGRRFMVDEGELTFNGPPERVRIDMKTSYAVPATGDPGAAEVTIGMEVSGTPTRLSLVLSSTPQMSNSDIISYIATGKPEGEGLGLAGGTGSSGLAMQAGTSLALSQLQGVVQGLAKDKVQLDVIEIRQDGLRGATLVAGRYVSSRVYLGFAQPLGIGQTTTDPTQQNLYPEAQVEYSAFRWLVLRLEGGVSDMRFLLRSRYAY